ncbi:hypothetical protein ACFQY7_20605 [Actinomadura luteofluorescens]|uniref:Uncharacterized protein n=1 Tax=Actinomadura luteofluorescens TaxID=46163 RepID=A0A7Y9EQK6_9ACTN|nr:hypothetical protein [Actinomadura luteofluorescens]NYD51320.1 hypothetical protein [Actinomadura luteofluorescens]
MRVLRKAADISTGTLTAVLVIATPAHASSGSVHEGPDYTEVTSSRYAAYVIEAFHATPESDAPAPLPPTPRLHLRLANEQPS